MAPLLPLFPRSTHRRQTQPASPFLPRQVPKHPPTSEKLPEAWSTSLTTGATRHRRRAPVRSATTSPSCFDALPPTFSCLAGAWGSHDVVGEHLLVSQPLGACCRPCHGSALCRERSRTRSNRRAGIAPGLASLARGPPLRDGRPVPCGPCQPGWFGAVARLW
jgi:hypothetical protein